MLLVLMYHQILNPEKPYGATKFKEHLNYLKANYPIILPGDALIKDTLNICLTFDDAYFDFYYYVFPLLQQLQIPAVLGIPTKFIQDSTTVASKTRSAISYPYGLELTNQDQTPLCTWPEIQEMVASGYIQAASHSHSHVDLSNKNIDIQQESQISKTILAEKLHTNINTLIFPFGKTSRHTNKLALQHYKYIMRIGAALNKDWQAGLIYRINADVLWSQGRHITSSFLKKAKLKYWLNYIRSK